MTAFDHRYELRHGDEIGFERRRARLGAASKTLDSTMRERADRCSRSLGRVPAEFAVASHEHERGQFRSRSSRRGYSRVTMTPGDSRLPEWLLPAALALFAAGAIAYIVLVLLGH